MNEQRVFDTYAGRGYGTVRTQAHGTAVVRFDSGACAMVPLHHLEVVA